MPRKKKSSMTEYANNISIWHKNIPLLYDSICQKKLECPSYACTFGNLINENKDFSKYRLFQSRATNANYLKDKHIWQGLPHALLICNVYIPHKSSNNTHKLLDEWDKNCSNKSEIISYPYNNVYNNNEECSKTSIDYEETKRIIHPGPILRIKQMHDNPQIIATHTQHKYVFLWNTSTQHDRQMSNNSDPNTPELILKGHKKDAVYALDFSRLSYLVSSGSKDNRICIWNINDYKTVLSSTSEPDKKERFVPLSKPSPKLKPRIILKGHLNEVSDVEFSPYSPFIIGSVSYDKSFKLWDIRTNNKNNNDTIEIDCSQTSVNNLFNKEITNLSWNLHNNNHILCASKNGNIKLFDIRYTNKIIKRFNGHKGQISCLQWNPSNVNSNYFLSSSHDGSVIIWDINNNKNNNNYNNNIVFKHIGHMNYYKGNEVIHSASWIKNNNSWCIASTSSPKAFVPFFWSSSSQTATHNKSISNNNNNNNNINQNPNDISEGGIMHIWRPSLLLKMDKNNIIKHLKEIKMKKFIDDLNGGDKKKRKKHKNKHKNVNVVVHKIESEADDNNQDVDIQMNDINNNNNNNNNNNMV